MSSQSRHPFVIAPNANMRSHLYNIFQIPKKFAFGGNPDTLRGFSKDACFIVYTEGWSDMGLYDRIVETLEVSGCTLIFCPEIHQVYR